MAEAELYDPDAAELTAAGGLFSLQKPPDIPGMEISAADACLQAMDGSSAASASGGGKGKRGAEMQAESLNSDSQDKRKTKSKGQDDKTADGDKIKTPLQKASDMLKVIDRKASTAERQAMLIETYALSDVIPGYCREYASALRDIYKDPC